MTLATPSRDDIRDQILRDMRLYLPAPVVTTEGSTLWARATGEANVLLGIYAKARYLDQQAFPDTCDSVRRAQFASLYKVTQLGAQYASGIVAVSTSYALTIPDGTQLTNPSNNQTYVTVGPTVVGASLSANAFVVALAPGLGGNAIVGTILQFSAAPAGVNSQATVVSLTGGDVAWSDARFAQEIIRAIGTKAAGGNRDQIVGIGNAVGGVEQTFVYPSLRGAGTLDVVITTSAASGSRVAPASLLGRVLGALQLGLRAQSGDQIGALPPHVIPNTRVSAVVAQPTNVVVNYRASGANPFAAWPPATDPTNSASWYTITAATSQTSFTVGLPGSGVVQQPVLGQQIGAFFPSVGFCVATITSIANTGGTGPWTLTVAGWLSSAGTTPSELAAAMVGVTLCPWCSQLTAIAGAPATGAVALTGALPNYFATLGPGEMTPLTAADTTRRRRYPAIGSVSPVSGLALWPTSLGTRAAAAVLASTDGVDATITTAGGQPSSPNVPGGGYLGAPPAVLTIGSITCIPIP